MTQSARAAQFDVDITDLDALCRDILQVVRERDSVATATEIKQDAAVSHNELHYRLREKLTAHGLVETWTAVPDGGGQEVTHVELTPTGEQAIADGLLEAITDTNTNLATLKRNLEELTARVDEKADAAALTREIDLLDSKMTRLRKKVEAADVRDDLDEIEQSLDAMRSRIENLDARSTEQFDALAAQLEELDARQEESRDTIGTRIDDFHDHHSTRTDALANALNAVIARLATLEDAAARSDAVADLCERMGTLEMRHERQLQAVTSRIDDLDARLGEQSETTDDRLDTLEARHERRFETTREQIADLEAKAKQIAHQVDENTAHLTQADEYMSLSKGDKRDYWRAQAREVIAEFDCRHHSDLGDGTLPDWKLLAHLEDVTLELVGEEALFDRPTIARAKRATLRPRCQHGWTYWLRWPWHRLRS